MLFRSRRSFLKKTVLSASTAFGAPAFLRAAGPGKSPSERIGVAGLGVRGRGFAILDFALEDANCEVTAVCDVDESIGKKRAGELKDRQKREVQFFQDLRKVFEDPAVDVVMIATPNHWHAPAAIWAMQAGKDVYVEKPVSHNPAEGRMLVECARKAQRICQAGTQARSSRPTRAIIDCVRSGKIGEVKLARGICHRRRDSIGPRGRYEPPSVVDYNLWLGPAPDAPVTRPQFHYDWHWQWPYGNGDLGNQGVHEMDIARWGLGVGRSRRVFSYGGRLSWDDAGDTANTQVVVHEFDGKTLVFEVRNLPAGPVDGCSGGVVFYGTEGRAIVHGYRGGLLTDLDGNVVEEFQGGEDVIHRRNFLKAVRSRKREDLNAEILEGHLSAALVHSGNISYRIGERMTAAEAKETLLRDYAKETREDLASGFERMEKHLEANGLDSQTTELALGPMLSLDPATETFGVPAADALLSREYRRPFVPIV